MNGIETIIQRLNTDAKAETDALLDKARQDAAAITARCQAQADKETVDLAARNQRAAAEREERLVSAAQMEARKTILAAKQAVMEEVYAKALEKLRSLPQDRAVEVLASLLNEAALPGEGRSPLLCPGPGNRGPGGGGRRQCPKRRSTDPFRRDGQHSRRLYPPQRQH